MSGRDSIYDAAADFGALYDAVPAYSQRADIAFYREEAERAGGSSRVLELGCGTGRLTLPLAQAGHEVTGIDLSPAMLARAREKLAAEPRSVQDRVTLVEGDARRAELGQASSFDVVLAPFRVLQHFPAISDQLAHSEAYAKIEAKARLAEIGTLYTAVAGMLNLLTMIDASYRAAGVPKRG